MAFLHIPLISTDPAHKGDTARAADGMVAEQTGLGFEASVRPTPGHPMVVAHHGGAGPQVAVRRAFLAMAVGSPLPAGRARRNDLVPRLGMGGVSFPQAAVQMGHSSTPNGAFGTCECPCAGCSHESGALLCASVGSRSRHPPRQVCLHALQEADVSHQR